MLKCCVRPLITLVLALVATGILSTLAPAREFRSPDGAAGIRATNSAKASAAPPRTPPSAVPRGLMRPDEHPLLVAPAGTSISPVVYGPTSMWGPAHV